MLKKIIIGFVLMLLTSSAINAQKMQSMVLLSDDYAYQDKWHKVTSETTPLMRDVQAIYRHQRFYIVLILGGFQTDKNDIPQLSYNIKALTPDGSEYFSYDSINPISYKVENPNILLMSNSAIGVSFEDEDLLGVYTISGTITDNISKEKISFDKKIELIDFVGKEAFANDTLFGDWMQNYVKEPKPEYAVNCFIKFASGSTKEHFANIQYSYFIELFKTNSFLMKLLFKQFSEQPSKIQNKILKMYVYTNSEDTLFLNSLNGKQRKTIETYKKQPNKFQFEIVSHPEQLDMLWAQFFASGSFEPIQKIVNSFSYSSYFGSLEKFGPVTDMNQLNDDSIKELVFNAATWSVNANLNNYYLVKAYCTFIYYDDITPNGTKNILAIFLNKEK